MVLMRVSELAERSGVPASTLRYCEERGLLPAQRSPAGYRLYDQRALERLAFITAAKQLGLDLDEIGELTAI
ncbi:MerR family transcriptional regulator [Nocardiopsis synnemataformans]|uniref:MerR family transcriptional regulator n=1 Tax=Nocardiopsis synnemataformans TaxID=61305 RepID=UPI003EBFFAAC